ISGGTGETFDWNLAVLFKEKIDKPFFLAGGLTPENVGEAVKRVHPWAVDAASGIEKSPRSKDFEKMKIFLSSARNA
ncbi:MAG TPA: N-(5'-phosphoribosyl)anthranilate isomerase, partial [bacterium]|nr:N-(5'-phosphoribosyl)anthranilate isomerase [bacterium]